jgi:hypothetical protein
VDGLARRGGSVGHARLAGASDHAIRIIETAQELAAEGDAHGRLLANLATLGYRGHPITKSRAYSVTFGQIRRVRRRFRQNPAGLDPEASTSIPPQQPSTRRRWPAPDDGTERSPGFPRREA